MWAKKQSKTELFETTPVFQALTIMAVPTIISQLIVLIYNLADTWFIGQTDDPYMVAAAAIWSCSCSAGVRRTRRAAPRRSAS